MSNLANILVDQGKQKEAISLMEECVQLQEKVIGPRHPDTVAAVKALKRQRSML
jgi:hypothetical protein